MPLSRTPDDSSGQMAMTYLQEYNTISCGKSSAKSGTRKTGPDSRELLCCFQFYNSDTVASLQCNGSNCSLQLATGRRLSEGMTPV